MAGNPRLVSSREAVEIGRPYAVKSIMQFQAGAHIGHEGDTQC